MFWTNAGNWPIWLRELIGASFYPLLLLEFLLLMAFSGVWVRVLSSGSPAGKTAVAVLPLLWALFLLIVVIMGANNLDNLIAGQPFHWHRE